MKLSTWPRTAPGGPRSRPEIAWRQYFETVGAAAARGLFDILAHPDLIKMWGRPEQRPPDHVKRYYELAIEGSAASGMDLAHCYDWALACLDELGVRELATFAEQRRELAAIA